MRYSPDGLLRAVAIVVAVCAWAAPNIGIVRAQPAPAPAPTQRLAAVDLQGEIHENRQRLLRFLGLTAGAPFGQEDQNRLDAELKALGYRQLLTQIEPLGGGMVRLHLTIEPMRIVRNVIVKHNWPLFDDEIVRHLSLRTGQPLPADTELRARLTEEAEAVRKYLFNEGYFEAAATVEPHIAMVGLPSAPRAQWIDLVVRVDLGPSYKLDSVLPTYDHEDGAKHLPASQLYDIFHHWLRFKVSQMRDDARQAEKVLRDEGFPAARVVPEFDFQRDADRKTHRVRLPVRVTMKRKVDVSFIGNRAIASRDLRDQLTIFSAGAYDDVELSESAHALQREYQKHGYFEARVTFHRALRRAPVDGAGKPIGDDVEEVTFTVDEGPELKVQKVEIVSESGAPLTFSATELRDKASLETRAFPALGAIGLGEGGYVTQLQLQQDAERIANLYKSRGFPAVKVRYEVARDPAAFDDLGEFGAEVTGAGGGHDLYVRFYVDEGRREIVDHVEIGFVGDHVKSELDVYKAVQLGAGREYTATAVEEDGGRILNLYKSSGRPFVNVNLSGSSWNPAHDRVVLRYVITEGPEVRFGEILIRGNFKTRASTIRKDLPFKAGDLYDVTKLEAAERNLATHLIFNSARVQAPVQPGRTTAPVLVVVQERYLEAYGALTFAVGAASDRLPDYAYLQATYLWSNFLGYGSQLELKGDFAFLAALLGNPITMGASLRYTDTRAFGPGWRYDLGGVGAPGGDRPLRRHLHLRRLDRHDAQHHPDAAHLFARRRLPLADQRRLPAPHREQRHLVGARQHADRQGGPRRRLGSPRRRRRPAQSAGAGQGLAPRWLGLVRAAGAQFYAVRRLPGPGAGALAVQDPLHRVHAHRQPALRRRPADKFAGTAAGRALLRRRRHAGARLRHRRAQDRDHPQLRLAAAGRRRLPRRPRGRQHPAGQHGRAAVPHRQELPRPADRVGGVDLLGHGHGPQPLGPGEVDRPQAVDRHQPFAPAHARRAAVDRVRLSADADAGGGALEDGAVV